MQRRQSSTSSKGDGVGHSNTGFEGDTSTRGAGVGRNVDGGDEGGGDGVGLQREMGLVSGISLIVGTIVGSGIWQTAGQTMYASGSVGLFILQYVIFGAIVTLGAICYIELACVVPLSGGETVYIKAALGDWCAFIYSWLRALVIGPSSCAYLAAAGAQNVLRLTPSILSFLVCSDGSSNGPGDLSKRWAETLIAIAATGLISAINMWSVKWSARLQNVLTVAKLVGMAVLIIGGLVSMVTNGMDNFQTGFDQLENLRPFSAAGVAVLAFNGGFAYDGWNQLNFITEEIKDPMKNLPRSIFIGMPLIMVIYTLTAVSYVAVLPVASYDWEGAGQNAADWADVYLGSTWSWIIPLCVAFSCFGSLNGTVFTAGRVVYSASREGHFPSVISFVNHRFLTPLPAILWNLVITVIFLLIQQLAFDDSPDAYYSNPIYVLLDQYMVVAYVAYGAAMLSLIVLRWKKPDTAEWKRPFKVPLILPALLLVFFWGCVALPWTDEKITFEHPGRMFLDNIYWLAPGLIGYIFNWYRRRFLLPTDSVNVFVDKWVKSGSEAVQKLLEVVPEHED